jgi:hypothetical protein
LLGVLEFPEALEFPELLEPVELPVELPFWPLLCALPFCEPLLPLLPFEL